MRERKQGSNRLYAPGLRLLTNSAVDGVVVVAVLEQNTLSIPLDPHHRQIHWNLSIGW